MTSDFGAHLVSQTETPVHQRREALADDPTPAFLRDALLSHSADEICPGLYLSGNVRYNAPFSSFNRFLFDFLICYFINN